MKKIDVGQMITILANLGVIAGIVFLAIEIQQNTRTAQASSYEALTGRIIELNQGSIELPGLGRGTASREAFLELSGSEQQQLRSRTLIVIRYGDLAFYQNELGMLSEDRFESLMRPVSNNACNWVFQDVWSSMRQNFVDGYIEYIDGAIGAC